MSYRDSKEFDTFVRDNFKIECVGCESILDDITPFHISNAE